MSFLDAAAGFATGFADEFVRQQDIQRVEDREREKELIAAAKAEAKTFSERKRAHEQMLQKSHQLHQVTGMGDPGAFFQLQTLGFDPKDIVNMVQENPNLFTEMGISTTRGANVGGSTMETEAPMDISMSATPARATSVNRSDNGVINGVLDNGLYVSTGTRAHYRPSSDVLNIAMDFNAAPSGNARGTEVIIPDNASPEVRQAAQRFNVMVANFAAENGIENYPIRGIRTRSQNNGRGVGNTVHAEPFFNSDIDMQNAIAANPEAFAQIYAQAFGGLPNARLIAPHGAGNDRGAASPVFGDETSFGELMASALLRSQQTDSPEGMITTMSTSGQIDPTDQQMAGAFSEPTVVPRMEIPQQPEPQQEQSGLDRFRTGFQRAFGMDDESREQRIQSRVGEVRSSLGLDQPQSGGGFASMPQTNFRLNFERPADLSSFPSIASADSLVKIDGVIAEAEAKGLLNQRGADQWLSAVEARRDALIGRQASSYLSGVNNQETAVNARNRALADIENGVIPPEAADGVLSAIDRTVEDILRLNWNEPSTYEEAKTRVRVATETQNSKELELLRPYLQALAPANAVVTNVIVRPTDGSLGTVTAALQVFDADTASYRYTTLDGQPLDADGAMIMPVTDDVRKAAAAVQSDRQLSIMYREATTSIADLSRYVVPMRELTQLMDESPEVATYTAGLALGIDRFFREANSMLGLLSEVSRERDLTREDAEEALRQNGLLQEGETLESVGSNFEQNARSGVIENLADARRAYEAYILLGTFRTGGIEGQEGRAVSNKLFEELQGFMRNARNSDQLRDRVRIQIDGMAREIAQTQQAITNHPQVRGFMQEFGYNPLAFGTLEDVLSSDPRLAEATEFFLNAPVRGTTTGTQPDEPNASNAEKVLNDARNAIARGADREAVIQRLIENGFDPSGL